MSKKLFTKLFKSILRSTLWVQQPNHVRITWITMLAMADQDGFVASTVPGLAHEARVSIEECEEALRVFMAPDKYSRTPDHEGRRIEIVMGGWRLLTYEAHRKAIDADADRERKRDYMREKRARERELGVAQGETKLATKVHSGEVASLSISLSESRSEDPDPEQPPCLPSVPGLERVGVSSTETPATPPTLPQDRVSGSTPGVYPPGRRERTEPVSGQPALRHKFRKDWKPKPGHRARGHELGLTDEEILERADLCRHKPFPNGFYDEDDEFHRQLIWARNDKETKNARGIAHGAGDRPGPNGKRRDGSTVFGGIGSGGSG